MRDLNIGSHDLPVTDELMAFMGQGWADTERSDVRVADVAPWAAKRRAMLHEAFPGERLVVRSGGPKIRAGDQYYRFRPRADYVWLTGDQTSDGVCVIEPDGSATLYLRPRSTRTDGEFFRDRMYGELWVGRRPTLAETATALQIETRYIDELPDPPGRDLDRDPELRAVLAELRMVKDPWEIAQLREAIAITTRGFEDVVRALPQARSERHLEGVFGLRARLEGNDVGYHSIVATGAHAATLHWIDNDGPVREGDLLLLDAGAEARSLYTADVTRVLPVSGRFSPLQRDLYELCRRGNDAALAEVRPGAPYRAFHAAAMRVYAYGLADLGVLPCPPEEALESMVYRRWTLCSSGHLLGLEVHDCASAPAGSYLDGRLVPGQVLTVEPGLYFQPDDLLIPVELRGQGFRIEEDVLVTDDGCEILTADLPRTAAGVEAWMAELVR